MRKRLGLSSKELKKKKKEKMGAIRSQMTQNPNGLFTGS